MLTHVAAGGQMHFHRIAHDMIHRLPVHTRTLQGDHWAVLLLYPATKGYKLTGGRAILDQLRSDLALFAHPTSTRCQLSRMHIDTTAHRMDDLHRTSLLDAE